MKSEPVIEYRTDTDPPLCRAWATYDDESGRKVHIAVSCHAGFLSQEAAVRDLAAIVRRFAESIEEAKRGGLIT